MMFFNQYDSKVVSRYWHLWCFSTRITLPIYQGISIYIVILTTSTYLVSVSLSIRILMLFLLMFFNQNTTQADASNFLVINSLRSQAELASLQFQNYLYLQAQVFQYNILARNPHQFLLTHLKPAGFPQTQPQSFYLMLNRHHA